METLTNIDPGVECSVAPGSTLVLQSHRDPLPYPFLASCLASVHRWAQQQAFDYRFVGDALFETLDPEVRAKTQGRMLIATDIARLHWLQRALAQGYDRVVWLDADLLVLNPDALQLTEDGFCVGRETWVQAGPKGPKLHRKVHNAFLQSCRGDVGLPFYLDCAQRLLLANTGGMPDQFVGPKLLTALHNVAQFAVHEQVNMLPPRVALDCLRGGGPYLNCYRSACAQPPAAVNLCSSAVASGELLQDQVEAVAELLLETQSL